MIDPTSVLKRVKSLISALQTRNRNTIREAIAQLVPTYDPSDVLAEPQLALVPNVADSDVVANDVDDRTA